MSVLIAILIVSLVVVQILEFYANKQLKNIVLLLFDKTLALQDEIEKLREELRGKHGTDFYDPNHIS